MKYLVSILVLSLNTSIAFSQKPPIKFGDVSIEELNMVRYEKDTSAEAVILADYGEANLSFDDIKAHFALTFDRLKRIKIFKKAGYNLANEAIVIQSLDGTEKITSIRCATYNLVNGKMVVSKMLSDAIIEEKFDENFSIIKLNLPNVKEGSIIEIAYRIESDLIFGFRGWAFQASVPTKWSEYRTRIPEYYTFSQFMQGYVPLQINEHSVTNKQIIHTYLVTGYPTGSVPIGGTAADKILYREYYNRMVSVEVPAFKQEPFMNNYRDYISRINFEMESIQLPNTMPKYFTTTWLDFNKNFLEAPSFGKVVKGSGYLNEIVEQLTAGTNSPREKVVKIYDFIKSSIEWDGSFRKSSGNGFKEAIEKKKGSSADINLMLVSMLQKAEIQADPVIISTRNHGLVREQVPMSGQFNYVIASAVLDNTTILLDATDRSLPMNFLPERCLNGNGYIISSERPGWIKLTSGVKSKITTNANLSLGKGGVLSGKISVVQNGYFAESIRKKILSRGEGDYLEEFASTHQWELKNSTFENLQKITEVVKEEHEVEISKQTQAIGDVIYMNPLITGQISENPFKAENRLFPVDFGSPSEQMFIGKYTLPEGYVVEEIPKPKLIGLPNNGGKYTYTISQSDNVIDLISQLVINQSFFTQTEYATLREFYNQVVAKQAEQIVLKKK